MKRGDDLFIDSLSRYAPPYCSMHKGYGVRSPDKIPDESGQAGFKAICLLLAACVIIAQITNLKSASYTILLK